MTTTDPHPGRIYEVTARIFGGSNEAAKRYFTVDVEMFAWEEDDRGLLLVLTEASKRQTKPRYVERLDGIWVDPDDIEDHQQIESVTIDDAR